LSSRWVIKKGDIAVYEILAILAGVLIGLTAERLTSTPLKIAAITAGSVAVGAIVSSISGELSISWGFLVFDIGQVLIAAAITMVLSALWRSRRRQV
jgi:hypothetical protein